MLKSKIALVILNYNDYEATIECCEGHLNLSPAPEIIIIVENGSTNASGRILSDRFGVREGIVILQSAKNLGFSGGFNLGIACARTRGYAHVICANSDTIPQSPDLIAAFDTCLETVAGIGLIAPQIDETTGVRNPEFETANLRYVVQLTSAMYPRTARVVRRALRAMKPRPSPNPVRIGQSSAGGAITRIVLQPDNGPTFREVFKVHGSYFLLTGAFLDEYEALDDEIFLQGEEHLISWMIFKADLRTVFIPDRSVFHTGGASKDWIPEYKGSADSVNFAWKDQSAKVLRRKISLRCYVWRLVQAQAQRAAGS